MIYGLRANGGEHGSVMTKPEIVSFMLNQCGYTPTKDLSNMRVLEPAAGDGAFVIECLRRLHASSLMFGFDFRQSLANMAAVEIDPSRADALRDKIADEIENLGAGGSDEIASRIVIKSDFLLSKAGKFDIVVGNPPYVRYEQIPKEMKDKYRALFNTFRGRADIYLVFFEKALLSLKENGQMCFICSNRWMKNSYGSSLRHMITKGYFVKLIVNLNNTRAFEEKVDGYPSIITIKNAKPRESIYLEIQGLQDLKEAEEAIEKGSINSKLKKIILEDDGGAPWAFEPRHFSSRALTSIEEQGFKIGIGVATGADAIFISRDMPELVEKNATIPIVMSRDIKDGKLHWSGNYLLNPFNKDGSLINLEKYPKLKRYLASMRNELEKRHIARKKPENWYRTIDPINLPLIKMKKILLPDLKKRQKIVIDAGNYYPHHNIYYISAASGEPAQFKLLAAVLMSDFILQQLSNISTIMRGGFVRWQSQNLKRLRIPVLNQIPKEIQRELIRDYELSDLDGINKALDKYLKDDSCVEHEGIGRRISHTRQTVLLPAGN